MKRDPSMRARLRALAKSERPPTRDAPARERADHAAGLARADERTGQGLVLHGLGMAGAAALILGVISSLDTRGAESLARTKLTPVPGPVVQAALPDAPSVEPVGPCANSPNLSFPPGAGERRLDLGARALMVANRPAIAAATQTADCDLRVGLAEGGVAVHARDLEGRTLVVSTPRGEVRVKGTVFEVEFYAASGELTVGVEEGRVELVTREGRTVWLSAGQAAYLGVNLELEPFEDGARAHLRRVLGLSARRGRSAQPEPEANAPEQPAPGEARAQTEPGSSITDEGRPVKKPRIKKRVDARPEGEPQQEEQE